MKLVFDVGGSEISKQDGIDLNPQGIAGHLGINCGFTMSVFSERNLTRVREDSVLSSFLGRVHRTQFAPAPDTAPCPDLFTESSAEGADRRQQPGLVGARDL
jgi:hypothetical protein